MKIERLLLLVAALAVNGCRCDGGLMNSKPDFTVMPTALNFNACRAVDDQGHPVMDVFPDRQTATVTNAGKVSGALSVTLDNNDAGFTIDTSSLATDVGPGENADINILFSPLVKGDTKGKLTIDDGDSETAPLSVDLVGTASSSGAVPTVEAAIEDGTMPGNFSKVCNQDTMIVLLNCEQDFPDTVVGDSVTLTVKLKNKGCPSLKVTGLDIEKSAAGADDLAFFLDSPSTPPSAANPLVMSQADGSDVLPLTIRFSPHMVPDMDTQRYATLTITTNDPNVPTLTLQLAGAGTVPSVYATPTFCNFTDPNDPCGGSPKVANQATFHITNGGSSMLSIASAKFKSTGMSGTGTRRRFTVMTPIDGTVLMPAQSVDLVVTHSDLPLFVIDTIEVLASPASAGKVNLTVEGGTEPCLATDPQDTLEFTDAGMTITTQPVVIKALATDPASGRTCGTLIVNSVDIETNPFFSVVAPTIPAGTMILPGSSQSVTVQYKKPVTGGRQAADLVIQTNDPAYADPAWKKVLVESSSPLNQIPVAVLKGCLNADCVTDCQSPTMTVHLSTSFPSAKDIYLCGGDSYDPGNVTPPGISTWQFVLGNHPGTATVDNNGMPISMNHTTLHLDPVVVGTYKVLLGVTDDTMQKSGTPSTLQVNVYQ